MVMVHANRLAFVSTPRNDRVRYNSYGIRKRKVDENKVDGFRQGGYSGIFTVGKGNSCGYFCVLNSRSAWNRFPLGQHKCLSVTFQDTAFH